MFWAIIILIAAYGFWQLVTGSIILGEVILSLVFLTPFVIVAEIQDRKKRAAIMKDIHDLQDRINKSREEAEEFLKKHGRR